MPKRSNDFQVLITLIERQLAADGVSVEESAMLVDSHTGERREVDICIRATINRKPVVFGLECRDHKRKADRVWVDGLIGKYRDLPVDKVFAVARAGFSQAALKAAAAVGIECLTFEQATAANWHLIADLPDNALIVAHHPAVRDVALRLVPGQGAMDQSVSGSALVVAVAGRRYALGDLVEAYCDLPEMHQLVFDTDHLESFPVSIVMPEGAVLVLPAGEERRLAAIEFQVDVVRDRSDTVFERKVYGDAGVSFATKAYPDGARVTFSMVQQGDTGSVAASVVRPDGTKVFMVLPENFAQKPRTK